MAGLDGRCNIAITKCFQWFASSQAAKTTQNKSRKDLSGTKTDKCIYIYTYLITVYIYIYYTFKVLVCKTSSLLTPSGSPPLGSRSIRSTDVVYLQPLEFPMAY